MNKTTLADRVPDPGSMCCRRGGDSVVYTSGSHTHSPHCRKGSMFLRRKNGLFNKQYGACICHPQAKKGRERSSPGPHGATWNCTNVNLHAPSYCSANSKWIIDSRAKTKAMGPAKVPEKSYGFGINKDFLATPEA